MTDDFTRVWVVYRLNTQDHTTCEITAVASTEAYARAVVAAVEADCGYDPDHDFLYMTPMLLDSAAQFWSESVHTPYEGET